MDCWWRNQHLCWSPNDSHLSAFRKTEPGKEMVNSTLVINSSSQHINVIWVKLVAAAPSIHGFTKTCV